MPFYCSICGEESTRICAECTKDACANHLCEKCGCCSDCCDCEIALREPLHEVPTVHSFRVRSIPESEPEPEPPHPPPDPDPFPEDEPEPGIADANMVQPLDSTNN